MNAEIFQTISKILFLAVVPGFIVYFRLKKKIRTGFAVGMVFTSLILSLVVSSTFQEDPIAKFENYINQNKHDEALKAFKAVVQSGPENIARIEDNRSNNPELYNSIKKELIREYFEIAEKYLNKYNVTEKNDCKKLIEEKRNFANLQYALSLVMFSESIGGKNETVKKKLKEKIDRGQEIILNMERDCK